MHLYDFLSFEALDFWFADEGQNLQRDLSAVHVLCVLYSEEQMLDFSVDIFGRDGIEALPIYSEVMPVDAGKVTFISVISPLFVTKMFDQRILQLFSRKGLYLRWNPMGSTCAEIEPLSPDPSMELFPEKQ